MEHDLAAGVDLSDKNRVFFLRKRQIITSYKTEADSGAEGVVLF